MYHADEYAARELVKLACKGARNLDDANVLVDTGWFQVEATTTPTKDQLLKLQDTVGGAFALNVPEYWTEVDDPGLAERIDLDIDSGEVAAVIASFTTTLQPPRYRNLQVRKICCRWVCANTSCFLRLVFDLAGCTGGTYPELGHVAKLRGQATNHLLP